MKLADSLNPATQAENIKKLNAGLEAVDAKTLPSTSTATTGQILKLTGETKTPSWADEYTPPAYSETETATGQKWIDGKDIYLLVHNGTFEEITQTGYITLLNKSIGTLISINGFAVSSTGSIVPLNSQIPNANFTAFYAPSSSNFTGYVHTTFSESTYTLIIYYTKPDPTPGRAPEQEVEEKKTTKKKTTK